MMVVFGAVIYDLIVFMYLVKIVTLLVPSLSPPEKRRNVKDSIRDRNKG